MTEPALASLHAIPGANLCPNKDFSEKEKKKKQTLCWEDGAEDISNYSTSVLWRSILLEDWALTDSERTGKGG